MIVKLKVIGDKLSATINSYKLEVNQPEDDSINPAINLFNKILIYFGLNPKFFPIPSLEFCGDNSMKLFSYLKDKKIINNYVNFSIGDMLTIQLVYESEIDILFIYINKHKYHKSNPWYNIIEEWNKLVDVIDEPKKKIVILQDKLKIDAVGYKAKNLINYLKENKLLPKTYDYHKEN
jgi:hypothetical protein